MKPIEFVPNLADDLHCLQACYIMARESLGFGACQMAQAESETGFVPGWPTWQFRMLVSLADSGAWCTDVEPFEPAEFINDPESTIRKQVGDDAVADVVLGSMSLEAEAQNLADCLAREDAIRFINVAPGFEHLATALDLGGAVVCNVNSKALVGEDGFVGHMVLVVGMDADERLTLHDPGLPARENIIVDKNQFVAAWCYPSPSMANIYASFSDKESWTQFNAQFSS